MSLISTPITVAYIRPPAGEAAQLQHDFGPVHKSSTYDARSKNGSSNTSNMSYSLNSLNGDYAEDYIGDYYRAY